MGRVPANRTKSAFGVWFPALLLVLLILLHVVLALSFHLRRGCCPAEVHHLGYHMTIDELRVLQGYVPMRSLPTPHPGSMAFFRRDRVALDLSNPVAIWRELVHGRLRGLWRNSDVSEYWNELPHPFLLPALIHTVSGGSLAAVALTPQIYLTVLLLSLFGLGRRLAGPWVGLSAAAIVSGYAGIFGLARTHHDSLSLAALTIALVYLLLRSDGFRNHSAALAAGVVAFLASRSGETVTCTMQVVIAAFGPFLVEVVRLMKRGRRDRKKEIRGALGLGLFLLLALSFFEWPRLMTFIQEVHEAHMIPDDSNPVIGPDFSPALNGLLWYLAYPSQLAFDMVRPVMTLWFLVGAVLAFRRPVGARKWALGAMVLIPLTVITVINRKAAWYLPPLLPPMAMITALGLARIRRRRLRALTLGLASACGLLVLGYYSIPSAAWRQRLNPEQYISRISKAVRVDAFDLIQDQSLEKDASLAEAARYFVEYLRRNPPPDGNIWLVAMLASNGNSAHAFRYLVELREPRVILVDLLSPDMPWEFYPLYDKERFDFLLYLDAPGLIPWLEGTASEVLVPQNWNMDLPRMEQYLTWPKIIEKLRAQEWERVDLGAGPVYRAVAPPVRPPEAQGVGSSQGVVGRVTDHSSTDVPEA